MSHVDFHISEDTLIMDKDLSQPQHMKRRLAETRN